MPIPDSFNHAIPGLDSPYTNSAAVTPDDDVGLAFLPRAVWVGGLGNLAVQWQNGTTETFTAVAAGTLLRMRPERILATGTTATLIKILE